MNSYKFLHTADIHLDSPLRGLSRYEGVPADDVRLATRTALNNLIEAAIDEDVAFVIIAGDLYDGDWPLWERSPGPQITCSEMGSVLRELDIVHRSRVEAVEFIAAPRAVHLRDAVVAAATLEPG